MKAFILGVDGGNSKTDYFLFDTDANFIDYLKAPTCSHEQFKNGYQGAYEAMKKALDEFFARNNICTKDIKAAVFGLAGVDTPTQKMNIEQIITKLGFKCFKVVNDSFLPIKAVTTNGYGVCSINGAGTSSGGIDAHGNYLQVGGIGSLVGDEAGGSYIARCAIRACFDETFRFGPKTSLTKRVMDILNVNDKYYLMEAISDVVTNRKLDYNALTLVVFEEAANLDAVAIQILSQIGENCARSVGGAIVNLGFDQNVDVVLAGSVWVKGASIHMINRFTEKIHELTNKRCNIIMLTVPPATGAVIWALELANNQYPNKEIRDEIIKNVLHELNKNVG